MLHLVNENLFSFDSTEKTNERGDYIQLDIKTSPDVIRQLEDDEDTTYFPSVRTFARLISPNKDFHKYNLALSTYRNTDEDSNKVNIQALFKCMPNNKYDSSYYVVAFPFNGYFKPIPESNQFWIYKYMISSSAKYSINFGGKKYKKIMYLIISPRVSLFSGDNAIDEIVIPLESFYSTKSKTDCDEIAYYHEQMTLTILPDNKYDVEWSDREQIDPFDESEFKKADLCSVHYYEKKPAYNNDNSIKTTPRTMEEAFAHPQKLTKDSGTTSKSTYYSNRLSKDDYEDERPNNYRGKKNKKNH